MRKTAVQGIKMLFTIKYASVWMPKSVDWLISSISRRIDKGNMTEVDDKEAVQYLMVYWVIIRTGPEMAAEESIYERMCDHATLNEAMTLVNILEWLRNNPDITIKMEAILLFLDMMNVREAEILKSNFGIAGCCNDENDFENFAEIRKFKERIFPTKSWSNAKRAIEGRDNDDTERFVLAVWEFMRCRDVTERGV